jgi:hypothetical membrane protein
MRCWTTLSAALAPISLIGGWTVAAGRQPDGFDSARDTISALAAQGAHDRWVMTAGLAVLGGCHVATALGLEEAKPLGRVLLVAGGVTAAGVAALPQPSSAHFPVATASFVALAVWPAFSGLPTRMAGVMASVGLLGLLARLGVQIGGGDLLGLSERMVAGAEALWPLGVVVALRSRSARG